jgi:aconitate hydratase
MRFSRAACASALPEQYRQDQQLHLQAIDPHYAKRARERRAKDGHAIIGGANYGQGSSREHTALAPRHLGLRVVIAKAFARIHWQNLVNFGILPLTFIEPTDYDRVAQGDTLILKHVLDALTAGPTLSVENATQSQTFLVRHELSARQIDVLAAGGLINWTRDRLRRDVRENAPQAGPQAIPPLRAAE